jgi:hypothetical protein
MSIVADKDSQFSSPAVEILPSKMPYKHGGEKVDLNGIHIFKGRVSITEVIGFGGPELISSKLDGSQKSWAYSFDLVNSLKHEIRDGQLSFRGKKVLELGCNYGLPGIFACLKGASTVHFQDINAETIRCTTIPNVLANLDQARELQSRQQDGPLTPSRYTIAPTVHFYAGEWDELPAVLSIVKISSDSVGEGAASGTMNLSFTEDDFNDACSSQDGSVLMGGRNSTSRRSRTSRAWERSWEEGPGEAGYDIILVNEISCSLTSAKKLYVLLKKCLRPPYGVIYMATKKNYVGFNSAAKQLKNMVDEDGYFGVHLVKELTDRDIWKFFCK